MIKRAGDLVYIGDEKLSFWDCSKPCNKDPCEPTRISQFMSLVFFLTLQLSIFVLLHCCRCIKVYFSITVSSPNMLHALTIFLCLSNGSPHFCTPGALGEFLTGFDKSSPDAIAQSGFGALSLGFERWFSNFFSSL